MYYTVYVYIYIYTYIHIYIYICIYLCTHTICILIRKLPPGGAVAAGRAARARPILHRRAQAGGPHTYIYIYIYLYM